MATWRDVAVDAASHGECKAAKSNNSFRLKPEMMGVTGRLLVGSHSIQATRGRTCNQIRSEKAVLFKVPASEFLAFCWRSEKDLSERPGEEIPEVQSGECWVFLRAGGDNIDFHLAHCA